MTRGEAPRNQAGLLSMWTASLSLESWVRGRWGLSPKGPGWGRGRKRLEEASETLLPPWSVREQLWGGQRSGVGVTLHPAVF